MTSGPYAVVLLASTFTLIAVWAVVLLVLVRLRSRGADGSEVPSRLGVELVWALIPALVALSIVVPALQSGWSPGVTDAGSERMADVRANP